MQEADRSVNRAYRPDDVCSWIPFSALRVSKSACCVHDCSRNRLSYGRSRSQHNPPASTTPEAVLTDLRSDHLRIWIRDTKWIGVGHHGAQRRSS